LGLSSPRLDVVCASSSPPAIPQVKDKDYGVDLEIEIFSDDGSSTGLMLFAQLKATGDIAAKQSVSMKVDRLNYLSSLDTPSMLVRYCDASEEFYFMWITNVIVQIGEPSTQTVTVKFSEEDLWTKETARTIPTTARVLRTIRSDTRRTPLANAIFRPNACRAIMLMCVSLWTSFIGFGSSPQNLFGFRLKKQIARVKKFWHVTILSRIREQSVRNGASRGLTPSSEHRGHEAPHEDTPGGCLHSHSGGLHARQRL
jgi:hypothetical protein